MLADCRPDLLIVDDARRAQVESLRAERSAEGAVFDLPLLNVQRLEPGLSEENPGLAIADSDLAYVLHLTQVYTGTGGMTSTDCLALLYSPSFAGAVRDIYCTLLNGATLCSFDVKQVGLAGLADWLRAQQITVFFAVATLFRHFCRQLTAHDRFPAVRVIELGSETVHAGDVHLCRRCFPQKVA